MKLIVGNVNNKKFSSVYGNYINYINIGCLTAQITIYA